MVLLIDYVYILILDDEKTQKYNTYLHIPTQIR